jgi:hypothetical protein
MSGRRCGRRTRLLPSCLVCTAAGARFGLCPGVLPGSRSRDPRHPDAFAAGVAATAFSALAARLVRHSPGVHQCRRDLGLRRHDSPAYAARHPPVAGLRRSGTGASSANARRAGLGPVLNHHSVLGALALAPCSWPRPACRLAASWVSLPPCGESLAGFGAVITFADNIPGQTQNLPLAICSALQSPGVTRRLRVRLGR